MVNLKAFFLKWSCRRCTFMVQDRNLWNGGWVVSEVIGRGALYKTYKVDHG